MAVPVVIVAAGARPVVNVAGAVPATVVTNNGEPITLVSAGGEPMTLLNEDGTLYGDLLRLIALSPSLLIWPEQGAGWQGTSGGTAAASGQPLGLGVDLSQLGGKTLDAWLAAPTTSEIVSNPGGPFVNTTGYTAGTGLTLSVVSGALRITRGASINQNNHTSFSTNVGKAYLLRWQYKGRSPASTQYTDFRVGTSAGGTENYRLTDSSASQFAAGVYEGVFSATATTTFVTVVLRDGASSDWIELELISVRELPGNHLCAGTWATPSDAARGTFQNGAINFDGSSDYYSLLNVINITESMTVVRAFKRASAGIDSVGLSTLGTQPYDAWWRAANDILIAMNAGTNSTQASGQTQTGSFVATTQRNATNEKSRLNGTALTPAAAAAVAGTFTVIGRRSTTYNSGEISFLALFPTELTGADLALVEQIAAATNGAVLA